MRYITTINARFIRVCRKLRIYLQIIFWRVHLGTAGLPRGRSIAAVFIIVSLALFLFVPQIFSANAPAWRNIIFEEEMPRISMDFQEANLRDVLKIFSQQANLNFVATRAIENRKITLYLKDVPVDEVLEKLLSANNLTYEKEETSNIFIVKDKGEPEIETETGVFYLKYARVGSSRLSKEIADRMDTDREDGQYAGSGTTGTTGGIGSNITAAIKEILTSHGHIAEDSRTNSLIVTDIPSRFGIIKQTIARLDIPIPQVMIEIEMLDTNQNALDELGIKFSNNVLAFTGPSTEMDFFFKKNRLNSATSQTTHFGTLSAEGLTATLQLLTTHTDTKYLARPRLLTLSNETSEIRITVDEAIGVITDTTGETGATTETAERAETGILLRVTPQVNIGSGEITMFLETSVAEAKTGTITLASNTVKDPEIRGTKSTVMVNDGETVVIGGLIRTDDSQVKKRVPFLASIPFLGALFRHREGDTKNRELVIFITPHIVKSGGIRLMQTAQKSYTLEREQGPLDTLSDEVDKALSEFER